MGKAIFIGVAMLLFVAVNFGKPIANAAKNYFSGGAAEPTTRAGAFSALDTLIAFFKATGCKEGEAAAIALGPHLFHNADDEA